MNEQNPYSPPAVESPAQGVSKRPPIFCQVTFIASLLLCCLRLPLLAIDLAGDSMGYDAAFEPTIIPGIASSAGIVVFGIIANCRLLGRISWGIPIGLCLILCVAASIGIDIWMELIARSLPQYRGTILTVAITIGLLLFRSVLLLLYCIALASYSSWLLKSRQKPLEIAI